MIALLAIAIIVFGFFQWNGWISMRPLPFWFPQTLLGWLIRRNSDSDRTKGRALALISWFVGVPVLLLQIWLFIWT